MSFSILGLLVYLIVAAICGGIGRALAGGTHGGCIVSIAVGFVGAMLGTWIAHKLRFPEIFSITVDRHAFPVVWAILGAALFVGFVHLLAGRE